MKIKVSRKEYAGKGKPVILTDENGSRFSGFDEKLQEIGEGDVINADIEVKKKGDHQYNNIISYQFIERSSKSSSPEKQSYSSEPRGAEAIAVYSGALALRDSANEKAKQLFEAACEWGIRKLSEDLPAKKANEPASAKPAAQAAERDASSIKNSNDLFRACNQDWPAEFKSSKDVLKELNLASASEIADAAQSYREIASLRRKEA